MELTNKTALFLGDSITEGVGVSCLDNTYWQVFGRNTGAKVWADGIGGTRITPNHIAEDPNNPWSRHFGSRVHAQTNSSKQRTRKYSFPEMMANHKGGTLVQT